MAVYFTPQAEADLEEIGDYIAADNPERVVTFIREIRVHCERIDGGPLRYTARPELGEAIRSCAYGNYVIFFQPYKDCALTLRVLHGARNLPELFM